MFTRKQILLGVKTLLMTIMLFSFSSAAYAGPLKNVPMSVTQPSGDILQCLASGDEFFNYLHDTSGNIIIQHPQTGYYTYAQLDEWGKVAASEQIATDGGYYYHANAQVKSAQTAKSGGLKVEDIDFSLNAELIQEFLEPNAYPSPAPLPQSEAEIGVTGATIQGRMENVIVLLCFAGESPTITSAVRDKIENAFNGSTQSLKHYLKTVSGSVLELNSTLVGLNSATLLMYQDSHPRSYYQPYNEVTNPQGYTGGDNGAQRTTREHMLLRDTIAAINGSALLSGKNLDLNGDGRVDSLTFIVSGNVGAWNNLLWPHKWSLSSYNATLNSKRVYNYSFQLLERLFPSSGSVALGTICHEELHVFGLPDLYRFTANGYPVAAWDIMSNNTVSPQLSNSHCLLRYAGWGGKLVEICHNGRYVLSPLGSATGITAYAIATANPREFILLEYKSNTNGSGYDSNFGTGSTYSKGLTIARINTYYAGNSNSNGGTNDEVYLYRPAETALNQGNGSYTLASFSADKSRTSFGNDSAASGYNGTIYLYNGDNTKYVVSNVSAAGETVAFDVKINNPASSGPVITYLSGNYGSISAQLSSAPLDSGGSVVSGDSVTFTATPQTAYMVDNWYINGVKDSAAQGRPVYTLNNIRASHTVICTFKANTQMISVSGAILYQTSSKVATVMLYDSANKLIAQATTNTQGAYTLTAPAGALYRLTVSKPGYLSYTVHNLNLSAGQQIDPIDISQLAGDINGDGIVNSIDLTYLLSEFNRAPQQYLNADINGDGIVNSVDLTYLLAGFNKRAVDN